MLTNPKILHLASDDKFIDQAAPVFERAFPGKNYILVFSNSSTLRYVKLRPNKVIVTSFSFLGRPKVKKSFFKNYDLVVFHSLGNLLYPEIYNIPKDIPIVWLGWGYDYYDLIDDPNNFLMNKTRELSDNMRTFTLRSYFRKFLRCGSKFFGIAKSRKTAIERVSLFSPVLENEYNLVKNSAKWNEFPHEARWNYGTIEDHLVKGFEDQQVESNNILVGNSASFTSNHIEILHLLKKQRVNSRRVIVPLSYGDRKYALKVVEVGEKLFDKSFKPLMDFMPIDLYVRKIKQCGYVIMNHKRQQAVGNIVIMLYLGARVFLREENPAYSFLKGIGVELSSIQQLEVHSYLLDTPLSENQREKNKQLVSDYWSRERGISRAKALVIQALDCKNSTNGFITESESN